MAREREPKILPQTKKKGENNNLLRIAFLKKSFQDYVLTSKTKKMPYWSFKNAKKRVNTTIPSRQEEIRK